MYVNAPYLNDSSPNEESPSSDFEFGPSSVGVSEAEFACIVRFLHDDKECGKIIGKGGGRIKEIRSVSKASVQLTKGTSLYPGTRYRVMKIMGDMGSVLSAVHLVLSSTSPDEDVVSSSPLELRMLIPELVVGALIGKGGRNIKEIKESTGATVYIKKQQPTHPDCPQFRITSINGTDRALLQALAVILTQLYSSGDYHELIDVMIPFQHPSSASPQSPLATASMSHGMHRFAKSAMSSPGSSPVAGHHHQMHRSPPLDYDFRNEYSRPQDRFASTRSGAVAQSDLAQTFFEMFQSFQKLTAPTWRDFQRQQQLHEKQQQQQEALASQNGAPPDEPIPALSAHRGSSVLKSPLSNGSGVGEHGANNPGVDKGSAGEAKEAVSSRVLSVPDEVVGSLIGTKGRTIQRIKNESGASITISSKGDYLDGTSNRKITVSGSAASVEKAQHLIIENVSHYSMMRATHDIEDAIERGETPHENGEESGLGDASLLST